MSKKLSKFYGVMTVSRAAIIVETIDLRIQKIV